MSRSKIKAASFKAPKMDVEEFRNLYNALYVVFGSQRKAAAAMGISYPTYLRWENHPPTWPYYVYVMELLLRARLRNLKISRKGFTRDKHYEYTHMLHKLESINHIVEEVEAEADKLKEVVDYLRARLMRKGMYWDQLRLARYSGGYSQAQLRRAARQLGVVMETRGYGDDKRTYWKLPSVETDEDLS